MGKFYVETFSWAGAITAMYYSKHLHMLQKMLRMTDYTRDLLLACVYVSDTACTSWVAQVVAGALDESRWPHSAACIAVFQYMWLICTCYVFIVNHISCDNFLWVEATTKVF